jgi:hypothetical protein
MTWRAYEEILLWFTILFKTSHVKNSWTVLTLHHWPTQVTLETVPVMISFVHHGRV